MLSLTPSYCCLLVSCWTSSWGHAKHCHSPPLARAGASESHKMNPKLLKEAYRTFQDLDPPHLLHWTVSSMRAEICGDSLPVGSVGLDFSAWHLIGPQHLIGHQQEELNELMLTGYWSRHWFASIKLFFKYLKTALNIRKNTDLIYSVSTSTDSTLYTNLELCVYIYICMVVLNNVFIMWQTIQSVSLEKEVDSFR